MIDLGHMALADPVSLLAGGVSFLLPAIGATGAKIIATVLLLAGLIGAQLLLAPKPTEPKADPDEFKSTIKGEVTSEINAIGRVRLGGVMIFGNTVSTDRYRLLGQCKGPADGVENSYLGGQEMAFTTAGYLASPPWSPPAETISDSYILSKNKIGDGSETAWPELLAAFPEQWSPAHRVQGIAQALTRYRAPSDPKSGISNPTFQTLYSGGEPPLEQVVRVGKPYDPRTGTYKWSDNGIVCALHVLLSWPEFSLADFDLAFIAEQADEADELVDTRSGTERRSRCWGVWQSETPRLETMQNLLRSIGAEIVSRPGDKLGIALTPDARTPELALPVRQLVELAWRSGPESVERPNLCVLKYYSPERQFEMAEIELQKFSAAGAHIGPAWARVQSEIDAFGEKPMTIDLPFCPSAAQAQRIARQLFLASRGDAGIATYNWTGLAAWGAQTAALEFPDGLGTPVCALGAPRVRDADGLVELSFVVWPTELTPWNPQTDEVDAPEALPDVSSQMDIAKPIAPYNATVAAGVTKVTVEPRGATANQLEANYRTFDAVTGLPSPWLPMTVPGVSGAPVEASVQRDLTGVPCEFRCRQFRNDYVSGNPDETPFVGFLKGYHLSPFSAVYRTVPAAAGGTPAAPAFSASYAAGSITITITAPAANVVSLRIAGGPPPPKNPIETLPSQTFAWTDPAPPAQKESQVLQWTAQAFTGANATGAGSTVAVASVTIPGTG